MAAWNWRPGEKPDKWHATVGNLTLTLTGTDPNKGLPEASYIVAYRGNLRRGLEDLCVHLTRRGKGFVIQRPWPMGGLRALRRQLDDDRTYESYTEALRSFVALVELLAQRPFLQRVGFYVDDRIRDVLIFSRMRTLLDWDIGSSPWSKDFDRKKLWQPLPEPTRKT